MTRLIRAVCVLSLLHAAAARAQTTAPGIVFQHANVVDVREGRVLQDQTVVIDAGRITVVDAGRAAKMPPGTQAVDATGKYLIPGLWDMHVHAAWPSFDQMFAPLFVANGVTGVREMYGSFFLIKSWKQRYHAGEPWPRMIGAGHILDGPKPFWRGSTVASTADEARQAVQSLHAAGADFIKVYTKLPRDAYFAALDEAKKLGTYAAGHVPESVSVSEASEQGQRSVEHLNGISLECSKDADALRAVRARSAADSTAALLKTMREQTEQIIANQDPARASALFEKLVRNRTWQCATLTVLRSMAYLNDEKFTNDPRLRYMPADMVKQWDWKNDFRFRARTPEDWENGRKSYALGRENVGRMHRAGVPFLAGTDFLNPYTFPGFSLHDELVLLTESGLSPADALRAATLNPAVFMNATDSLGTVEPGKRADLVLLDANPLADIRNTQKIRAVVLNGHYYDRAALDALMAASEKKARP
jgi:imidazolonepropionase-like amidohydrolase